MNSHPPVETVPRLRRLPRIYRALLGFTRRRGLFTIARLHCRLFPRGQIVDTPAGGEMFIPPDPHFVGFLTGLHEEHIRRVLQSVIEPGSLCLDVGANIGYFSVMMSALAGPEGCVRAFEPEEENFSTLLRNARLRDPGSAPILPQQVAISDHNGFVTLSPGAESTLHQVRETGDADSPEHRIPSITLDSLSGEPAERKIRVLKVDVEGHELPAIEGAREWIASGRIENLIIEVTPGEDAVRLEDLLGSAFPSVLAWVGHDWTELPLSRLQSRTDVWASSCPRPNRPVAGRDHAPRDPFSVKHLPKFHPVRVGFTLLARYHEWVSRKSFPKTKIPWTEAPAPSGLSYEEADTAVLPPQMDALRAALEATENLEAPVVEIGAFRGVTTEILAKSTKRTVFAVDPFRGYGGAEAELAVFQSRTREIGNLVHLRATSGEASRRPELSSLSLVFVDAVHDYVNARFDGLTWAEKLLPGGLIAFHDTDSADFPGVARAVREMLRRRDLPLSLHLHIPGLVILKRTAEAP